MIRSYLIARIRSFGYAFNGVRVLIYTQPHARLHLISTVIVLVGGAYLKLERSEWLAILICIGMVWMAEAMNTAIEFLADEVSLEQRERIGKTKDVAAAGVLIVAIISAVVALVILINHFHIIG
jgi:diacylglycerol kinase (ATP)